MKEFFTVSELNGLIKEVVNYGFPNALWICGEIQSFDRNRHKNHIFFELCEKDPQAKDIVARIGLVIFAGRKNYIEETLKSVENAFQLKDDIEVKFLCRIDFYPPHGAMRLIVEGIDPVYTLGKIAQERQKLIALLRKEGILEKNKALVLPALPLRIGLITSFDSAAYNDFISELKRSGIGFSVHLMNALMQGRNAEASVCAALDRFNRSGEVDVVIITRGGGSIAELSCFDSRVIAERIAASRLPVLSGIGHEINVTITDLAAHTYAKTPTAIAQFLIECVTRSLNELDEKVERLFDIVQEKILHEKRQLRLLAMGLQKQATDFFRQHDQVLAQFASQVRHVPLQKLTAEQKTLVSQRGIFLRSLKNALANTETKIKHYTKLIDMVSPKNTLKRGFSITRTKNGKTVRHLNDVKEGDEMVTEVLGGSIPSQVIEKTGGMIRGRGKV